MHAVIQVLFNLRNTDSMQFIVRYFIIYYRISFHHRFCIRAIIRIIRESNLQNALID